MTREEAKTYIIRHCNPDYPEGKMEWEQAMNMAIKALEQPEPCDDAVSRKSVRHALCKAVHKDKDIPCENQTASCLWSKTRVCDYVREIDALPSVTPKEQRWISVKERLPEKNGRYLATRGLKACNSIWNRVYIINYSDLMGLKAEKIWWDGNVGKSDFERIDDVLAWCELPEPYTEEGEK